MLTYLIVIPLVAFALVMTFELSEAREKYFLIVIAAKTIFVNVTFKPRGENECDSIILPHMTDERQREISASNPLISSLTQSRSPL